MKLTDKLTYTNECNMKMMSRYPDKYFDIMIIDPPYFDGPQKLGYYGKGWSGIGVERDPYESTVKWDVPGKEFFDEVYRVSKHQIIFGANYYATHMRGPGRIIWDKCNKGSSFSDAEIAYCSLHDSVRIFKYMWNGMLQGKSATEGHIMQGNKKLNEKRIHMTQKPVWLYKWLFTTYVNPEWKVGETNGGSMSIGIAAIDYDIDLTACEIGGKEYADSLERLQDHLRKPTLFTNNELKLF